MKVKVYFSNEQQAHKVGLSLKRLCRRAVKATLSFEGVKKPAEVSVTFVDNARIRELNAAYRQIDRETDVLSFPLFEEQNGKVMLGDIVLSLERCEEQGVEFGHGFLRELSFLTVHSTLHLLGYDHENGEEEEKEMRRRQSAIVAQMGYVVKENKA